MYEDKSKTLISHTKDTGSIDESSAVFKNDASSDVDNDKKECETTFNNRKYNNCNNLCMYIVLRYNS